MSKVDDELTRRLHRAERPVEGDAVFEGLERRRSHRERARKVQAGMLVFAVLAATAAGFAILRDAFDTDERHTGVSPSPGVLSANGEIVFSREGDDGRFHLFASEPDGTGLRQITSDSTDDTDPAVSPDGRTIAYIRASDEFGLLAISIVPSEGGDVTKLAEGRYVDDPAWSPDGREVAFVTSGIDSMWVQMVDTNAQLTRSLLDVATPLASPSWSPDGTRIALGVVPGGPQGSVGIIPTNTMAERLLEETLGIGSAPAWSPDGSRIALIRSGGEGDEIWTIAPDGTSETLLATWVKGSLQPDLAWAPDGTSLLVSDGDWIYRVDPAPEGDPRENFVRLIRGRSPSWQPLPADSDPTPTASPEPSVSSEPELAGHDIGLGFRLCHLHPLSGIDLLGDGTNGKAWTGTKILGDGTCPNNLSNDRYGVAVDVTGDGVADSWSGETIAYCGSCEPFKAVDLNGDGRDELIVITQYFSIMQYGVYTVLDMDGEPEVVPFRTGEPGHTQHGLNPGMPFTFWVGGDAGSADWFYCDSLPEFWLTGTESPIDPAPGDVKTIHETHVSLERDGIAHILYANTYTVPADTHPDLQYATSQPDCGLGVDIWRN